MTAKKIGDVEYVGFSDDELAKVSGRARASDGNIVKAAGLRDAAPKPKVSPAEAVAKANAAIDASRALLAKRAAKLDAIRKAVDDVFEALDAKLAKMTASYAKSRAEMEAGVKRLHAHFAEQDRQIEAERKVRFPGWG
jgi:hypothetical protein